MKIKWNILFFILILVYSVAFIGSLFTSTDSEWYSQIKPAITPPNWVFPVVWNILFFLISLSIYFSWISGKQRKKIMILFIINLFSNLLWSFLFFALRNPTLAFIDLLVLLWPSTFLLIITARKINKLASWLLIPYIFWLSFAALLNYLIVFY